MSQQMVCYCHRPSIEVLYKIGSTYWSEKGSFTWTCLFLVRYALRYSHFTSRTKVHENYDQTLQSLNVSVLTQYNFITKFFNLTDKGKTVPVFN
jgi:hypothetical protein